MSKVDVVPALMELTVYRGAEADPGGTFTKLASALGIALSSFIVSACPGPFLNSSPSTTGPPAPRASLSISLNELVPLGPQFQAGWGLPENFSHSSSLVCRPTGLGFWAVASLAVLGGCVALTVEN